MSEEKPKMHAQDFENLQRILSGHAPSSLTIMGLTLTFAATGFAGIFAVATTTAEINKGYWNTGLGIVMVLIMSILWVVWSREHALGEQTIKDLEAAHIAFPKTPGWQGATAKMWTAVFRVSTIGWTLFALGALIAGIRENAG